jgi:hypothetical protein
VGWVQHSSPRLSDHYKGAGSSSVQAACGPHFQSQGLRRSGQCVQHPGSAAGTSVSNILDRLQGPQQGFSCSEPSDTELMNTVHVRRGCVRFVLYPC